jgi:type II secretory pathway pseudopilin PulG
MPAKISTPLLPRQRPEPPCSPATISRRRGSGTSGLAAAFTTIELMVAIAIGALMMLTAIPAVRAINKPPLSRAVNDFLAVCRHARAEAILTGQALQVVIIPTTTGTDLKLEPAPILDPYGRSRGSETQPAVTALSELGNGQSVSASTPSMERLGKFAATLPNETSFSSLFVNGRDPRQAVGEQEEIVIFRFFPNGTCDQLDSVLTDGRESRRISTEILTGQATVTVTQ